MDADRRQALFTTFLWSWGLLIIVQFYLFDVVKNASFKKKWWPRWSGLMGFWVFLSIALKGFSTLAMIVGLLAGITYWFISRRLLRVCNSCGTSLPQYWFATKPDFCPKCGAKFEA